MAFLDRLSDGTFGARFLPLQDWEVEEDPAFGATFRDLFFNSYWLLKFWPAYTLDLSEENQEREKVVVKQKIERVLAEYKGRKPNLAQERASGAVYTF